MLFVWLCHIYEGGPFYIHIKIKSPGLMKTSKCLVNISKQYYSHYFLSGRLKLRRVQSYIWPLPGMNTLRSNSDLTPDQDELQKCNQSHLVHLLQELTTTMTFRTTRYT